MKKDTTDTLKRPVMEPPKGAEVLENESSVIWFDKDGIVCSVSKKVTTAVTLEETIEQMGAFVKFIHGKKICLLADVTNSAESSKEARDYAAAEFPKYIKAIAMISESALGRMLANLFFAVRTQPYPTKMFNSEQEARGWLKQYL